MVGVQVSGANNDEFGPIDSVRMYQLLLLLPRDLTAQELASQERGSGWS